MSSQDESVAIFWDYENCELPASADGFTVASGISSIAHQYGSVKVFKAYFEMSELTSPRAIAARSDLQACGVSLIDCPHNGRKDVADKMMLVDMLAHAIDTPAPATVVLISGDRDFVYAVSVLRLRRYRVVVLAPTAAHASLRAQASAVYEWPRHVLPADPAPDARAAWAALPHDGHALADLPSRTGLCTPPDSARATPTLGSSRTSCVPSPGLHKGHCPSTSATHSRTSAACHRRASPSTSSSASGSSAASVFSFPGTAYTGSLASVAKDDGGIHDLSYRPLVSSCRQPWPADTGPDAARTHERPPPTPDDDDARGRGSQAGGLPGATGGSSPALGGAPLPPQPQPQLQPYAPALPASASTPEPPAPDQGEPAPAPAAGMTRLRAPPAKYRALVAVLERERAQGSTRVAFSQLGSMLRAADAGVYKRAGARQLRDYAAAAEADGVVILGTGDWENGNRWTALHPTYHGKPPETPPPPPPPMAQALAAGF